MVGYLMAAPVTTAKHCMTRVCEFLTHHPAELDTASTTNTTKPDVFIIHTRKDHTYPRSIETLYNPAETAIYLEVTPNFDDFDLSGMATKHSHRAQRHRTTA